MTLGVGASHAVALRRHSLCFHTQTSLACDRGPYERVRQAYLNGVDVPYIFHFNTLVAKVLGAVGSVAGGLAIGKEGPFVHAGAAIAAIVSQVWLQEETGHCYSNSSERRRDETGERGRRAGQGAFAARMWPRG